MTGDGPELFASAQTRPSSVPEETPTEAPPIPNATDEPVPGEPAPASQPELDPQEVLEDYRWGWESRHASLIGRREVLTGKAKFGIFGDGKELPQLALARAFRNGDFRSGYYRDQTMMLATGMVSLEDWFSQLYADPDPRHEPASRGRQMNSHFATRTVAEDGSWLPLAHRPNSSADSSPTGSQMPRLVGLAQASKVYRELDGLDHLAGMSDGGNEIAWGTIGNASCAEGMFWESVNALGVLGVPAVVSIWDDEYGISVHNRHQVTKSDLSAVLAGFRRERAEEQGLLLETVQGWDYPRLRRIYAQVAEQVRREHVPALIHVVELTQPQGHSTSGSHERYKSAERLAWEQENDGLVRMRQWILSQGIANEDQLDQIEKEAKKRAQEAQREAWTRFTGPIHRARDTVISWITAAADAAADGDVATTLNDLADKVQRRNGLIRRHLVIAARDAIFALRDHDVPERRQLVEWVERHRAEQTLLYGDNLTAEGARSALAVEEVLPEYADDADELNGFEVLNRCFDEALGRIPELLAFGEDLGKLGDVNQGFAGLQEKYGDLRVADVGIRECTILGQAIGLAMRGIRPLAEIQYVDYIHYALQIVSDDLATLRWRTAGAQKAPVVLRTRGHRFEGIWHSGSPMSGILGLTRGVWLCVPRDMTRAAGMYNTLLQSDDSAIVVEVLNGYRLKERLPKNVGTFTVPLGVPETLRSGSDVTLVTYGACCRVGLAAAERLEQVGIEVEVIDVQTLLPFDLHGKIGESLRRTNRIVFLDEDVPGGGTAFMMQQVIDGQDGYAWLDSPPRCLSGAEHRPAYASDGDYWSKPNAEQVFDTVYELMHETDPRRFPLFYR
ncbi:MAG: thiamine pyrophosphate-dependent enzyme [Thermoanaerobaculia bacterium]|nr:thiamine pyrophosphate-dependent enzyme [Thermoanaerobaculia bacterium]